MPRIDLCFSGWVRGLSVNRVYVPATDKTMSTIGASDEELVAKLKSGEWSISQEDVLTNAGDQEFEISNIEVAKR